VKVVAYNNIFIKKNIKIYKFKLDINDPFEYIYKNNYEAYKHYLDCTIDNCKKYCIAINNFIFNNSLNKIGDIYSIQYLSLYDINNNQPNKINVLNKNIDYHLNFEGLCPTNNFKSLKISQSLEEDNNTQKNIRANHVYFIQIMHQSGINIQKV
jgi:hypothetical protein